MKTVRCSGLRASDKKRCLNKIYPSPTGEGWCNLHETQSTIQADLLITCGVCLDNIQSKSIKFNCGHFFHTTCAKSLRDIRCPICREPIKSDFLTKRDIKMIESRNLEDKYEREGVLLDPLDLNEDDNIRDFVVHIDENPDLFSIYSSILLSCKQQDDINTLFKTIVSITGSLIVITEMLYIERSFDDVSMWLMDDMLKMFPNESPRNIFNLIQMFYQ